MAAYHATVAELSSCDRDSQAHKVYLAHHRKGLPTPALERKGNEGGRKGGKEGKRGNMAVFQISIVRKRNSICLAWPKISNKEQQI